MELYRFQGMALDLLDDLNHHFMTIVMVEHPTADSLELHYGLADQHPWTRDCTMGLARSGLTYAVISGVGEHSSTQK
jgi:hypothetical protein